MANVVGSGRIEELIDNVDRAEGYEKVIFVTNLTDSASTIDREFSRYMVEWADAGRFAAIVEMTETILDVEAMIADDL